MSERQLTLFVTFYIQSDKIEDWKSAHRPAWAACAKEPECLYFDVFELPQTSQDATCYTATFRLVEVWDASRDWFETQQLTKPYYATLWEKSKPTWQREVEIEYFERLGEGGSFKSAFLEGCQKMD